jgi:hypothetical protein
MDPAARIAVEDNPRRNAAIVISLAISITLLDAATQRLLIQILENPSIK